MWKWSLSIFLLTLCSLFQDGHGVPRVDPLVDTKIGLIRGLTATDGDYSMFMGIPYAIVDQDNPFGLSTPHPGFNETFEAYDDSAICPQIEEFNKTIVGTLDCLHVNVYVPNSANARNRLPVLVWIYGGGFAIGFAGKTLYGPKYFMKQDILLVTLNYRLGPYGFMCLDTPDVPGNQGLRDQELALKWIKDNIGAFGGDDSKITIFGESAGGASVDFQLTYGSEKLFNQVIMQSGTSLAPWSMTEADRSAALQLASSLGYPTTDTEEALTFLASVEPKLVIAATESLKLAFRPCVENTFETVKPFINDYPVNIRIPNLGNMPVLLGHNSDESLDAYEVLSAEDIAKLNVFDDTLRMYFDVDDEKLKEMADAVTHFYIGDEPISEDVKEDLIRFSSDIRFNFPTIRTINKFIDNGVTDIYYYIFFYDGKRNFVKDRLNVTAAGVTHADEIAYLFDISYMNDAPMSEDQLIIDRVTTLWANFAKFGNPTPQTTELLPFQWPAVTKDILYNMNIDTELKVEKRSFKDRMTFWQLFYTLYGKYQIGNMENNK